MSLRSRVRQLMKQLGPTVGTPGRPLTGAAYAEADERFHRECDEWRKAFIRGKELPLPVHAGSGWKIPRLRLVYPACVKARLHRVIPPTAYLPGMTEEERKQADAMCGAIWATEQDRVAAGQPTDGPISFPEFKTLWQMCTERYGKGRTSAADEDDV